MTNWLSYKSVQFIRIENTGLALVYYSVVLAVLVYVIGFTIIKDKGYQEYDNLVGSTMLKAKGFAQTSDGTIYDAIDLVQPAKTDGLMFIGTNMWKTHGQTRGSCEGSEDDGLCLCELEDGTTGTTETCCINGDLTDYGRKTGGCGGVYCEVEAWCPVEAEPEHTNNLMHEVYNWTVLVRTNVQFPNFGVSSSNVDDDLELGQNLFQIGPLCEDAGLNWTHTIEKGGIILLQLDYDCDVNGKDPQCAPVVSTIGLTTESSISSGFNYRYADVTTVSGVETRDLTKIYGVNIVVALYGKAGRFSVVALSVTLGAGLAFLSIATLICDTIMEYLLPHKDKYTDAKYHLVDGVEDEFLFGQSFKNDDNKDDANTNRVS